MRVPALLTVSSLFCATPAGAADIQATFLGQTVYTTAASCPAYKKLVAGGPRSLNTVPETLSASGYASWEGGCRFTNIDERYKGRIWTVSMRCDEGAIENVARSEVWRRQADGSLTVTLDKTSTTLIACAVEKPAVGLQKK
jgi:hypothetical protein